MAKGNKSPTRRSRNTRAPAKRIPGKRSPHGRVSVSGARIAKGARPPRTLTAFLAVDGADEAIEWYQRALGAKEVSRAETPEGKIVQCELAIGDSTFFVGELEPGSDLVDPKVNGVAGTIYVRTKNVEALFAQAVANGCEITVPLENQFWGERFGKVRDPYGHIWSFGSPVKLTAAERQTKERRQRAVIASSSF
jgi:PhnB protein